MDARAMLAIVKEYDGWPHEIAAEVAAAEREECAKLAEEMGRPEVAAAIRSKE